MSLVISVVLFIVVGMYFLGAEVNENYSIEGEGSHFHRDLLRFFGVGRN